MGYLVKITKFILFNTLSFYVSQFIGMLYKFLSEGWLSEKRVG